MGNIIGVLLYARAGEHNVVQEDKIEKTSRIVQITSIWGFFRKQWIHRQPRNLSFFDLHHQNARAQAGLLLPTIQHISLLTIAKARAQLVNSTYLLTDLTGESEVYVSWYLFVNVVDSLIQDVPLANVTVTFPNATLAESKLTDAEGWARFTLSEKMMNATGDYPIGNYTVAATYDIYSDQTTVNMTENKQITLTLADFVIPEFPSFLILPLFRVATLLAVVVYKSARAHAE